MHSFYRRSFINQSNYGDNRRVKIIITNYTNTEYKLKDFKTNHVGSEPFVLIKNLAGMIIEDPYAVNSPIVKIPASGKMSFYAVPRKTSYGTTLLYDTQLTLIYGNDGKGLYITLVDNYSRSDIHDGNYNGSLTSNKPSLIGTVQQKKYGSVPGEINRFLVEVNYTISLII